MLTFIAVMVFMYSYLKTSHDDHEAKRLQQRLIQVEDAIIEHNQTWDEGSRTAWIRKGDSLQREKRLTRDSLYIHLNLNQ
jgi:hypothetical protein